MSIIGRTFKIEHNQYRIDGYVQGETRTVTQRATSYSRAETAQVPTFRVGCTQTLPNGKTFNRILEVVDIVRFAGLTPAEVTELNRLKAEVCNA